MEFNTYSLHLSEDCANKTLLQSKLYLRPAWVRALPPHSLGHWRIDRKQTLRMSTGSCAFRLSQWTAIHDCALPSARTQGPPNLCSGFKSSIAIIFNLHSLQLFYVDFNAG